MSIIYDALKKSQKQREQETKPLFISEPQPSGNKFLFAIVGLGIVALTYFFLFKVTTFFPHKNVVNSKPTPVITKKNIKLDNMILNGVFISNHEKYAMINEQMYQLGDQVQGNTIIDIKENSIRLKHSNSTATLTILGA